MMKKSMRLIILAVFSTWGVYAQDSPTLLTVGDEEVSLAEFERIYQKNNNASSLNKQSPSEYLELFINFKLKVKEAEALGMDTTSKFLEELEGYRKQLAKPYLSDDEAKEAMLKEAYEWSKFDVKASHILIRLPQSASPEDTLAAYEKMMGIRKRILKGEPFEDVARATSDDASVQQNGGNLNYFTVFSMVYPFEAMAYTTPVGKISLPFRTSYGYHIIKVHDKRPARGTIKVRHIFVRTPQDMPEEMLTRAYEKIHMVYDSLEAGADFNGLALRHSEDPGSARSGGELPWFGAGRMIPEFENASFSLDEPGDYSKPFKSSYGWHIVKLIGKRPIGTFEEMKAEMLQKINQGGRSAVRSDRFIQSLKDEYGYAEDRDLFRQVVEKVDSSLLLGKWEAGELKNMSATLFRIGDRHASAGEFARYVEERQGGRKAGSIPTYLNSLYEEFTKQLVMNYEESKLPEKYPEFRYIYEEYHDGILLFDIMDQKVWSRAVEDSSGLEAYHKKHRKAYMWGERTEAYLLNSTSDADLEGLRKAYKKILKGKWDEADLNQRFCNSDSLPCITLNYLLVEAGENTQIDELKDMKGPGPVVEENGAYSFVIIKGMRAPEPKKLDEARGQITSDYQEYLEEEWIRELREKYPVAVDTQLLDQMKSLL